jgi:hypothetical protein
MYRLITLGAAMLAGAVQAATLPSDLMLPVPERRRAAMWRAGCSASRSNRKS